MKKDQYIPHEVSMRSNSQVINLIETEGCAGYGIYWALLEYLRVQENYIGDLQALSSLKRQLKIRQSKLDKVLYGYDLFVCVGNTFYSPKLIEVMKPFEERRARIEAYKRNKEKANSLESSNKAASECDIISFEVKGKGEGKGKEDTSSPISSSSSIPGEEVKAAEAAVVEKPEETKPVTSVPAWERYIDELQQEESKTPDLPDKNPVWDNSYWLARKQDGARRFFKHHDVFLKRDRVFKKHDGVLKKHGQGSPKYSKLHNELLRNDRFGLWQVKTKYQQSLLYFGKYRKFAQECKESVYEYLSQTHSIRDDELCRCP